MTLARRLQGVPLVVTGGSGFVGLGILAALSEVGIRAQVLDRVPPPAGVPFEHDFLPVDLTDRAALLELRAQLPPRFVLVHTVARITTGELLDAEGVRELGQAYDLTATLLEVMGDRLAMIVFLSSVDVYGSTGEVLSERLPYAPERVYGLGKWLAEELLAHFGRQRGIPVTSLQLSHVYGPFEHLRSGTHEARAGRLIPNVLRCCLEGRPLGLFGDGSELRNFVHTRDVAQAVVRAILAATSVRCLIASQSSCSVLAIVKAAQEATGRTLAVEFKPRTRPAVDYRVEIGQARRTLGYRPTVELVAGLREEAEWMTRVGLYA